MSAAPDSKRSGLALEGMAGAAAGAGLAASSAGDSVEFFTCKLGEQLVQGRFSKVTFKDGDALEMVITPQRSGLPLVLAARRDSDRVLWMAPRYSRGAICHRSFAIRLGFGILTVAPLVVLLFNLFFVWFVGLSEITPDDVFFHGAICLGLASIAAPHYAVRFYRQWLPIARQAEPIFASLGYPDPSLVDLPRDHKRYCKSKGIGWP